jgi:hypothetical protein
MAPNAGPERVERGAWATSMREPDSVPWLVISLVLSVVLTVLLNLGLRVFPDASRRIARDATKLMPPNAEGTRTSNRSVRAWMPWKAMLLGSVILTIAVNVILWIARE